MIHHGNEKVQKDHDIDNGVAAKHQHSPESGESFDFTEFEVVQVDQSEHSPEQSLNCFEQTATSGAKFIN